MNIYIPRSQDSAQSCQQSSKLSVKPRQGADSVAQGVLQGAQLKRKKQLGFANNRSCNILSEPSDGLGTKKTKPQNRKNNNSLSSTCTSLSYGTNNGYNLDPNTSWPSGQDHSKSSRTSHELRGPKVAPRRCPLRIAELAEPSKRQCIQTWRNKEGTLPGFMLERLRRQVMNQKIVANIPDAIHCFQIQPKSSAKTKTKNGQCRKPTKWELETANYMKTLCAVFAHNIAKKLMKPKNITLTDDHDSHSSLAKSLIPDFALFSGPVGPKYGVGMHSLQNLGNIVATEISKLISSKSISSKSIQHVEYVSDPKLLNEMSDKVAFWMAGILKEAEFKVLEDELRAKKRAENKKGKDGDLATLMESNYIRQQRKGQGDLEEEEGPALDAIDSLFNNVMTICLPKTETYSDNDSNDKEDDLETRDTYEDSITGLREFNTNYRTSDQIENNTDESVDPDSDMNNMLNEKQSIKIPDIGGVYDISPQLEGEEDSEKYGSSSENGDENLNNNVSDDLVKFEESLDDRKKVKFTNVDNDDPERREGSDGDSESRRSERGDRSVGDRDSRRRGETDGGSGSVDGSERTSGSGGINEEQEIRESGTSSPTWMSEKRSFDMEAKLSTPSLSRIRSDIVFHPPNRSLLNIVDELWPVDLYSPSLKPSASVSKSITSLGKINEYDEIAELKSKPSARVSGSISSLGLIYEKEESFSSGNDKTGVIASWSITSLEQIKEIEESSFKINFSSVSKIDIEQSIDSKHSEKIIVRKISPPNLNNIDFIGTHILFDEETKKKVEQMINYLTQPRESTQFQEIDDAKEIKSNGGSKSFKDAGKGDHIDREKNKLSNRSGIDNKQLLEVIEHDLRKDKVNESIPKFDYKVHPQTAPAWAVTSPSDESDRSLSKSRRRNKGKCELHRWCRDLEHTLGNLDQWNNWLQVVCTDILLLKQRTDVDCMFEVEPINRHNDLREWIKLKRRIDKDALLWKKLSKRTFEVLQNYHRPTKSKSEGERLRKKKKKSSLCDAMYTIEGLSLWLHRSIVSTEHCVKCSCNDSKRTSNVDKICLTRSLKHK